MHRPFFGRAHPLLHIWLLASASAFGVVAWVDGGSAHPGTIGVTWAGTAARILETRCVSCHGPDGEALPRLDTYEHARQASQSVKQAVLGGHVPRWHAVAGFGAFGNDQELSAHEVEMLAQWADGRAPHGDGEPPSSAAPEAIDVPDVVLAVPSKHRVTAASHTFDLGPASDADAWVGGWRFEPGNRSAVAGAVIALSSGRTLGTWAPGDTQTMLPDGVAMRMPAGVRVRLTVHYRRPDGPAVDASRVGLYLRAAPGRELETVVLPCGTTTLPRAMTALAIRPHTTTAVRSMSVVAKMPDRRLEPLAWFQDTPAGHTQTYQFRDAIPLPRRTVVRVDGRDTPCGVQLDYIAAGAHVVPPAARPFPPLDEASRSELWCPMHADMRARVPGVCSRCGMELVPMRPRVEGAYWFDATVAPAGLAAGEPGTLRMSVREPRSATRVREFETIHDRRFHLFIVSDDMREFSHVHPVQQADGSLELPVTFTRPGAYRLYADFLPAGGTPQMIGRTVLIGGTSLQGLKPRLPSLDEDWTAKADEGLRVRLHFESGGLVAGIPSLLAFSLEDAATNAPVTDLEPLLGAWGHVFILGGDLVTAVHSHPTTPLTSAGGPKIHFYQRFPRAGAYRLWVQFQRGGAIATVPFTVHVAQPQGVLRDTLALTRPSTRRSTLSVHQ
jgi:mono/diheme cytochrome c family protein